jgi:signal peptidase I
MGGDGEPATATAAPASKLKYVAATGLGLLFVAVSIFVARYDTWEFEGPSMEPTIFSGDRVLSEAVSADELARGDIVVVRSWHAKEVADVLARLESSEDGLTSQQVAQRLALHGPQQPGPRVSARAWWRVGRRWRRGSCPVRLQQ